VDVAALEMTKWFDTNYHYLVPELTHDQQFSPDFSDLLAQIERAKRYGKTLKVVVPGLLTFLYLSRITATQTQHEHKHAEAHHLHDESCLHDDQQPVGEAAETVDALKNMVQMAHDVRAQLAS
jgi:5-methyltetrahydropteroyltriglutamate--homocysteine methyltransferase